jgi:hypothetical protein
MAQPAKPINTRINDDGAGVVAGATVVVMLQLAVAVPAAESAATAVKVSGPPVVGVPKTAPVEVFRVKPGGSAPVIEYV